MTKSSPRFHEKLITELQDSVENWKFFATQILREINFCDSGISKSAILKVLASHEFLLYGKAEI